MDGTKPVEQVEGQRSEEDRERLKKRAAAVEAELQYLLSATPTQRYYQQALALASKGQARAKASTSAARRPVAGKPAPHVKMELMWDKNLTEAHRIADVYAQRVKAGTEQPNPDADALVELLKSMDSDAVEAAS